MDEKDYPALYQASDSASIKIQASFLNCIRGYICLLILGSILGVYGIESKMMAWIAAIFFLGATFISILMATKKFESLWYRSRAVAESVKTSTWRFMMRVEPYEDSLSEKTTKAEFSNMLQNILNEHKDVVQEWGGKVSEHEQISKHMLRVRSLPLEERLEIYSEERIDEQRGWYARKSEYNKRHGSIWFIIMICLQGCAMAFVLLRIGYPEWKYWPAEMFVVAAMGVLTWIQVKRYRELSAAYSLAAHEIGVIRGQMEEVDSEASFSQFVGNAENAFSREHTQWVARKD